MKIPSTGRLKYSVRYFSVLMIGFLSLLKNKFSEETLLHSIINEVRISISCFKLKSVVVIIYDNKINI